MNNHIENRKKPELLMPAGSLEVLKVAFRYGADAVYLGGDMYGLRAKAHNFSDEEMIKAIDYAHKLDKKIYVTVNITAHNEDLEGVTKYLTRLNEIKPDALIISDPGVFSLAKKYAPALDIHISTQANNVNYQTYNFWHDLGATRVVSARELSISEIADIRKNIPEEMEIETFIHGAMCISYSGRCLLSNYLTGRDANLGACTHPCRWKYYLVEENRPGEYMPIEENERGTFIFNSKDLCMIEHIPDIIDAGIDSLKVEGRMKTALYVATVARAYRLAIDTYFEDPKKYEELIPYYFEEVGKCTNRRFTTGFFYGKPGEEAQIYENSSYVKDYVYLGEIGRKSEDYYELIQKNKFSVGEKLELMKTDGRNVELLVKSMKDEKGEEITSCPHAEMKFYVQFDKEANEGEIIRKKAN